VREVGRVEKKEGPSGTEASGPSPLRCPGHAPPPGAVARLDRRGLIAAVRRVAMGAEGILILATGPEPGAIRQRRATGLGNRPRHRRSPPRGPSRRGRRDTQPRLEILPRCAQTVVSHDVKHRKGGGGRARARAESTGRLGRGVVLAGFAPRALGGPPSLIAVFRLLETLPSRRQGGHGRVEGVGDRAEVLQGAAEALGRVLNPTRVVGRVVPPVDDVAEMEDGMGRGVRRRPVAPGGGEDVQRPAIPGRAGRPAGGGPGEMG